MNKTPALALAGLLAAGRCFAAEPSTMSALPEIATAAGVKAEINAPPMQPSGTAVSEDAARSLQARYPSRPAVFHADGSVSQYLGASQLLQTVVRLDADGKVEKLCTSGKVAAKQFVDKPRASATQSLADGAKP